MKIITHGPGDEATWPRYEGHPADPRGQDDQVTEEFEAELFVDIESFLYWLQKNERTVEDNVFDLMTSVSAIDVMRARDIIKEKYIKSIFTDI
jgi:hypothetical protein